MWFHYAQTLVSVWLFIICTVFCILVFRLLTYCLQSFGKYRRDKLSTLNFLFIFSTDVETWRIFPVRCNHRQKCEVERKESDSYLRHPTNLTCKCSIKEISFFIESSHIVTFSWKSNHGSFVTIFFTDNTDLQIT